MGPSLAQHRSRRKCYVITVSMAVAVDGVAPSPPYLFWAAASRHSSPAALMPLSDAHATAARDKGYPSSQALALA